MIFRLMLVLLAVSLPARYARSAENVFYVAPYGSNAWSGKLAAPNASQTDGPFATVERAQAAARSVKGQPTQVRLRGGTHLLSRPLIFSTEDSGTAAAPIVYAAYGQEKPVLSGGRRITGWQPGTVNGKPVWKTELPAVREGKWNFHQLWVDGQRRTRARHPNDGLAKIEELPNFDPKAPYNLGQKGFKFKAGDLRQYQRLEEVDVVVVHYWVATRLAVTSVDETGRIVNFLKSSRRRLVDTINGQITPSRYYVENALELLDAPGEWYLDRTSGTLYYWPMPGETPAATEVIAPALEYLVRLDGKPAAGQFIEHLKFRNLAFMHSEWWLARDEPGDIQAAMPVPATIQGEGVRYCAFEDCTVAHVSNYGIHLAGGCQQNRISGCDFYDLGAGGVKLGEAVVRDPGNFRTHDNEVSDNHIFDGGRTFHQAIGVWLGQTYNNRIAHNHIHDFFYTGISIGWTWGYGKALASNNLVEFNHVHDLGKDLLSDMGGIYTLGNQPGTLIRNNIFHDISGYTYGGWGIYFDEGSTDIVAEKNLVYNTKHAGFHQHYGSDNVVRNNIFVNGREAQIQRTREEPHRSFTFEKNIVAWTGTNLLAGNWNTTNVVMDSNVYWNQGRYFNFVKSSPLQWQAKGRDQHSVLADPLFVNPAKNDYRLQPGSPAFRLGFEAFDLSTVGPRPRTQPNPP
jgi:parallel beta-helix repeat protein